MIEVHIRPIGPADCQQPEDIIRVSLQKIAKGPPFSPTSIAQAVDEFEAAVRCKSGRFRCYRAWEISGVRIARPDSGLMEDVSFAEFGQWLCRQNGSSREKVVHVCMREPLGFAEILRLLHEMPYIEAPGSHRGRTDEGSANAGIVESMPVTVVVSSMMMSVQLKVPMPVTHTVLIQQTRQSLGGSLGAVPFDLFCRGVCLSEHYNFSNDFSSGEVLFYRAADCGVIQVGVMGHYKDFRGLLSVVDDSNSAQLHRIKCHVLREFGVNDPDGHASTCTLRSADTHDEVDDIAALGPRLDLVIPDSVLVCVSVLRSDVLLSQLGPLTRGWGSGNTHSNTASSPVSSPLAASKASTVVINHDSDAKAVVLMRGLCWAECLHCIGRCVFGSIDELFDVLDGADVLDSITNLSNGTFLLARPFVEMVDFRCFNFRVRDGPSRAGGAIPTKMFPLATRVLFDQVRDLWNVPPGLTFRLFAPSLQRMAGPTEISINGRINVPKAGKIVKVSVEPDNFVVVNLLIEPSSYAMLDDLLSDVPRSCRNICIAQASLADRVHCLRDIGRAFNLPGSVTIASIQHNGHDVMPLTILQQEGSDTSQVLTLETSKEYTLILRQAAPPELSTLSLQAGVPEVELQQLWSEHCSLEEIAWVLNSNRVNIRAMTVDNAMAEILSRRQQRIPNIVLICVEAPETEAGKRFSISPRHVISYILYTYDVSIVEAPAEGCDRNASRWFFECQTPETASMLYHVGPVQISDETGRFTDVVIFLEPNADDAVYGNEMRPRNDLFSIRLQSSSDDT